jgi:hypothetical protein
MKIYKDTHLDLRQTTTVNIKQWVHDNGPSLVEKVDTFFQTQAGQR